MARTKKYAITFRLSATVELTEKQLLNVVNGNCSAIRTKLDRGEVKLGGGDSYLPGCWLTDDDNIPQSVKDAYKKSGCEDVDITV